MWLEAVLLTATLVTLGVGLVLLLCRPLPLLDLLAIGSGTGMTAAGGALAASATQGPISGLHVLALGVLAVAVTLSGLWSRRRSLPDLADSRPAILAVAGIVALHLTLLLLLTSTLFPVFPPSLSIHDHVFYTSTALTLGSGPANPLSQRLGDYLLAAGIVLDPVVPHLTLRALTLTWLALLPLQVFAVARRLTGHTTAGLFAALVYSIAFQQPFFQVIEVGLYANLVSYVLSLSLVLLVAVTTGHPTVGSLVLVAVSSLGLLYAHSTGLFLLGGLVVILLLRSRQSGTRRVLLALGLPLVGLIVLPASGVARLLATLQQPGVLLGVPDVPPTLLGLTIFGLSESLVLLVLFALGAVGAVLPRRRDNVFPPLALLVIWLGLALALTLVPANTVFRWRVSIYAWFPAVLLLAATYDRIFAPLLRLVGHGSQRAPAWPRLSSLLAIVLLVMAAALTGFGGAVLAAQVAPARAGFEPQLQRGALDAILWLRDQVPDRQVGVLSMGLAPLQFLPSISGHTYRGDDPLDPEATLASASERRFGIVAMHALLRNQTHAFAPLFDAHPAFERLYQNGAVIVYRITRVSS